MPIKLRLALPIILLSITTRFLQGAATAAPSNISPLPAMADKAFAESRWAEAAALYKRVQRDKYAPQREPEIWYRIGYCSEKAIPALRGLIDPARFNSAHHSDAQQFAPFLAWMKQEQGYWAQFSEGDSMWRYDGTAYRTLLKSYPDNEYADDAAFYLVRIDTLLTTDPGIFFANSRQGKKAAEKIIADYQGILARYPKTNKKAECKELIKLWQAYRNDALPPPNWL